MSHSLGALKFASDNKVMFYEYNGTSDVCISHLYDTIKEVSNNWGNHDWLSCACDKSEPVEIYSNYGGGFYWKGKACRACFAITENCNPYDHVYYENDKYEMSAMVDGLPEWMLEGVKYIAEVKKVLKDEIDARIVVSKVNGYGFYIQTQYFTPELLFEIAELKEFEKLVEDFEANKSAFPEQSPIL